MFFSEVNVAQMVEWAPRNAQVGSLILTLVHTELNWCAGTTYFSKL